MTRFSIAFCLCAGVVLAQDRPCLSPSGDYILARDLARAIPQFAPVPPEKILAPAPIAGGKRIFHADEIRSLAAQSGAKIDAGQDVCFAWPEDTLKRDDVLAVLRKSLETGGIANATLEITDLTSERVPPGKLEFPLDHLSSPASPEQRIPVLWRGGLLYADTRRITIWVRVRITAPVPVLLAGDKLEVGHPITAGQLRVETRPRFPVIKDKMPSAEQVIGMVPIRTILSGTEIRWESISHPNDVNRGDLVSIEAWSGPVKLAFSGRAEAGGHLGDLIAVRNLSTQRVFQARISAKGKAIVDATFVQR